MKEGKLVSKILGMALAFLFVGAVVATTLPLGALGRNCVPALEDVPYT